MGEGIGQEGAAQRAALRLRTAVSAQWPDRVPVARWTLDGRLRTVGAAGHRSVAATLTDRMWCGLAAEHGVATVTFAVAEHPPSDRRVGRLLAGWLGATLPTVAAARWDGADLTDDGRAWLAGDYPAHVWRMAAAAAHGRAQHDLAGLIQVAAADPKVGALRPLIHGGHLRLSRTWGLPAALLPDAVAPLPDGGWLLLRDSQPVGSAADPAAAVAAVAVRLPEGLRAVPGSALTVPP